MLTEAGLYPGMTVRELRGTVPGVEFTDNEGSLDSFSLDEGDRGGYWGRWTGTPTPPRSSAPTSAPCRRRSPRVAPTWWSTASGGHAARQRGWKS